MEKFIVRFVLYQYNGGGGIKNGFYTINQPFDNLEKAKHFRDMVQRFKDGIKYNNDAHKESFDNARQDFLDKYIWDGYIEKIVGIYKNTEEKIE